MVHYYRENKRLRQYLIDRNKSALYEQVATIHQKAAISFIRQSDAEQYGTATPLKLAESMLREEEAFFVFMGDDLLYNPNGISESAKMVKLINETGAAAVATCVRKPAGKRALINMG